MSDQREGKEEKNMSSSASTSPDHLSPPPPPPLPLSPPSSSEQRFYIHCNLCDNVLAVNVPKSLCNTVITVRCGHCKTLISVNLLGLALPTNQKEAQNAPSNSTYQPNPSDFRRPPNRGNYNVLPKPPVANPCNCECGGCSIHLRRSFEQLKVRDADADKSD